MYITNPATGRRVKANGRIGRRLMQIGGSVCPFCLDKDGVGWIVEKNHSGEEYVCKRLCLNCAKSLKRGTRGPCGNIISRIVFGSYPNIDRIGGDY